MGNRCSRGDPPGAGGARARARHEQRPRRRGHELGARARRGELRRDAADARAAVARRALREQARFEHVSKLVGAARARRRRARSTLIVAVAKDPLAWIRSVIDAPYSIERNASRRAARAHARRARARRAAAAGAAAAGESGRARGRDARAPRARAPRAPRAGGRGSACGARASRCARRPRMAELRARSRARRRAVRRAAARSRAARARRARSRRARARAARVARQRSPIARVRDHIGFAPCSRRARARARARSPATSGAPGVVAGYH